MNINSRNKLKRTSSNQTSLLLLIVLLLIPFGKTQAQYEIDKAIHAGSSEDFLLSSPATQPRDFTFNNNGTKMFVMTTTYIREYTLGTAYDVSTASYAGAGEELNTGLNDQWGMAFNNDGSRLFIVRWGEVKEYSMSSNFDISTATQSTSLNISTNLQNPRGISFNSDGSKMFLIGKDGQVGTGIFAEESIITYGLSSGFDLSSATYSGSGQEVLFGFGSYLPEDMLFNDDGTMLFVLTRYDESTPIIGWELSTPYDILTRGNSITLNIDNIATMKYGMAFNGDGSKLFVAKQNNGTIVEFDLPPHPVFENTTPRADNVDTDSFDLEVDISDAGDIYYVLLADGSSVPSVSEVMAGTGASGAAPLHSGNQTVSSDDFDHTFSISGLSVSTAYDVYVVARDDESPSNIQPNVTKLDVSTSPNDAGYALNFDGVDDFIHISDGDLSVQRNNDVHLAHLGISNKLTIESWIYVENLSSKRKIISKMTDNATYGPYIFEIDGGKVSFSIDISGSGWQTLMSSTTLSANEWHHVAAVYDGSTMKVYINGAEDNSRSQSGDIQSRGSSVKIGGWTGGDYFDGKLDEVRVWSDARTSQELLSTISTTLNGTETGLLAYYKFDQVDNTYLPDLTSNNLYGTLNNISLPGSWETSDALTEIEVLSFENNTPSVQNLTDNSFDLTVDLNAAGTAYYVVLENDAAEPSVTQIKNGLDGTGLSALNSGSQLIESGNFEHTFTINGDSSLIDIYVVATTPSFETRVEKLELSTIAKYALNFDGTDDYVDLGNPNELNITDEITIEAWIKGRDLSGIKKIVTKFGAGAGDAYNFEINNKKASFLISSEGSWHSVLGATILEDNHWNHVAATYDGYRIRVFVNGILDRSIAYTGTIATSSSTVKIGSFSGGSFWDGSIDEVRIWNISRTQSEIQDKLSNRLVGNESGLVAYYRFDETSGTNVPDLTSNAINGTATNMNTPDNWTLSGAELVKVDAPTFPDVQFQPIVTKDLAVGDQVSIGYSLSEAFVENNQSISIQWMRADDAGGLNKTTIPGATDTVYTLVNGDLGKYLSYTITLQQGSFEDADSTDAYGPVIQSISYDERTATFDGSNDFINLGNGIDLANTTFTIEFWAKRDNASSDGYIISQGTTLTNFKSLFLGYASGTSAFEFGSYGDVLTAQAHPVDQEWHHWAVTYDNSTQERKVFLNGELNTSDNASGSFSGSGDLIVGGWNSNDFDGLLDDLRIWDDVRTEEEIRSSMYKVLKGDEANLIGYWKFNDGLYAQTAIDETSSGNNGTKNGDAGYSIDSIKPLGTFLKGNSGWRMLTAPIEGITYATFLNNVWTQGYTGATEESGSPNVYWYNEETRQWSAPSNSSNIVGTSSNNGSSKGKAILYYAYDGDGWPKSLSTGGTYKVEDLSLTLSETSIANDDLQGWHLVGNPYPFSVDWVDIVDRSGLTNVIPVIFIFDPVANNGDGGYRVNYGYDIPNLPSSVAHDGIIEPFQGFWVRTSGNESNGVINFRSDDITSNTGIMYAKESQTAPLFSGVLLSIENDDIGETVLLELNDTSVVDLPKPVSLSQSPVTFGIIGDNSEILVYKAAPEAFIKDKEFQLHFDADISGTFDFTLQGYGEWGKNSGAVLTDHQAEKEYIIKNGNTISFDHVASTGKKRSSITPDTFDTSTGSQSETNARFTLKLLDVNTVSIEDNTGLPTKFDLKQNYPNPFNPTTQIEFDLAETGQVRLAVYDLLGRQVALLVDEQRKAGSHSLSFDATNLASGIYLIQMQAGEHMFTHKMTLVK